MSSPCKEFGLTKNSEMLTELCSVTAPSVQTYKCAWLLKFERLCVCGNRLSGTAVAKTMRSEHRKQLLPLVSCWWTQSGRTVSCMPWILVIHTSIQSSIHTVIYQNSPPSFRMQVKYCSDCYTCTFSKDSFLTDCIWQKIENIEGHTGSGLRTKSTSSRILNCRGVSDICSYIIRCCSFREN